ncbi:uncharacterized protein LOC129210188 isoform X2 [Grus americana]|uniref:uncharacterized protein LOC129210188 isoform X2 n=1 Tax=Grus americana TaxID=9117 RepID=UPI0024078653|nr:uncharacterized protein LOC129210188 isoform X2 [Grus americana]
MQVPLLLQTPSTPFPINAVKRLVREETMASEEPAVCSFVDRTTWELLNLLHMVARQNGRVVVMEVDDDNVRTPSVLVDFAQDLCGTADIRAKLQQAERMEEEEEEEEEEVRPHLVFMLWKATVLKQLMQWDHLDEAVWNVRNLLPCLPYVLVLVMIHPDPQEQLDEAVGALRRMQCLLDGAWQLVVEAAVYSPGQPGGILDAKRAACRALREVLNCHEEVDSQGPFIVSLPEFSYCCALPEHMRHKVSKTAGE